jgi:superfamily II DNA/RNA helicase
MYAVAKFQCFPGNSIGQSSYFHILSQRFILFSNNHGLMFCCSAQRAVLEPAMQGKDMVGRAKTGTGKTLAFGIPILDAIIRHNEKNR